MAKLLSVSGKYQIKGKPQWITFDKNSFVASGGEGSVYVKGQTAYKLYNDPSKMMPEDKVRELSVLTDPNIIRPQDIILGKGDRPVGYTMRYVPDSYALVQLFTKAFRQRQGLSHEMVQKLVQKLRGLVSHVHSHGILIVDLNEMNFLVSKMFDEIFAIDTDSYQTLSYPATAIMDSIRDRHAKKFSELTDWFSFGIISFQMFIGIHPYKGKHPKVKDMDERMQRNISVFNNDVSTPHVCYPLDVIPDVYKQWYKAIFEDGQRIPPPADFQAVAIQIQPVVHAVSGSNNFDIAELFTFEGNAIAVQSCGNLRVLTDKRMYLTQTLSFGVSHPVKLFAAANTGEPILAKLEDGKLELFHAAKEERHRVSIDNMIYGQDMMVYNDYLYIKNDDQLQRVEILKMGSKMTASACAGASILGNATKLYDGVAIQNLLGATYVSMFPQPGEHRQKHIEELDDYRIIDAKYDNQVLMVVGVKNGKYDRLVIRFAKDWSGYDVRVVKDITHTGLNFVTLDKGVVICINEEEEVEAFTNRVGASDVRIIKDPMIGGEFRLFRRGSQLLFAWPIMSEKGWVGRLYSMTMSK